VREEAPQMEQGRVSVGRLQDHLQETCGVLLTQGVTANLGHTMQRMHVVGSTPLLEKIGAILIRRLARSPLRMQIAAPGEIAADRQQA